MIRIIVSSAHLIDHVTRRQQCNMELYAVTVRCINMELSLVALLGMMASALYEYEYEYAPVPQD